MWVIYEMGGMIVCLTFRKQEGISNVKYYDAGRDAS